MTCFLNMKQITTHVVIVWRWLKNTVKKLREYTFSQRTVNQCNRMPRHSANATSVNLFKNKIGDYFKRSGYVYRCGL